MSILLCIAAWVVVILAWVGFCVLFFSREIKAAQERDPAAKGVLEVVLLYPGFHAIVSHRLAHALWVFKIPLIPRVISQVTRFLTGVEIHPGARIAPGLFIDHGMGVVIGETAVLGENVTLFQGVTLGGTGKEIGKRHPTLGNNVVVGTGAKVLGDIEIGENSYIGANAVIIKNIPANATVVGVPGRITRQDGKKIDNALDHIHVLDPVMQNVEELLRRVRAVEEKLKEK